MIISALIDLAFLPLQFLLSLLPEIDIEVGTDILSKFFSILDIVMYILPVQTVVPILLIIIAINLFRIQMAIIRTVWKFLPFIGR